MWILSSVQNTVHYCVLAFKIIFFTCCTDTLRCPGSNWLPAIIFRSILIWRLVSLRIQSISICMVSMCHDLLIFWVNVKDRSFFSNYIFFMVWYSSVKTFRTMCEYVALSSLILFRQFFSCHFMAYIFRNRNWLLSNFLLHLVERYYNPWVITYQDGSKQDPLLVQQSSTASIERLHGVRTPVIYCH